MRCAIPRDMLRIGREDDNDIRIPSGAVHRYHAAIHREDYDDWHITDLSGVEGNGMIVNGRRCCEAQLRDGDLIQLGPGRLRFRAGSA
jgi:pSer/pThr/pTyr-binding forkhead associated (FHA) protein